MKIWNRIKSAWNALLRPAVSLRDQELLDWLGIGDTSTNLISEATYFTCLKLLSETMGKLPIKYYKRTEKGEEFAEPNKVSKLLTDRPNNLMTPTTFWGTVEYNCQHYGNSIVWIRSMVTSTHALKVKDLWPVPSNCVDILVDDAGIFGGEGELYYKYTDPRTSEEYLWRSAEVMHFKTWMSKDGVTGEPVKNILKDSISGALEGQNVLSNMYKNGLSASMAMQYTGDLDDEKRKKLQQKFADILSGPKNAGKVIPVPIGLQLTPLKMTMADAQFLELRKYSALQIASAFGIKPNQINNYEKSSYSNSEMQQLTFLVDTVAYRLKMYEEEINYKILPYIQGATTEYFKFNEKALLRTDSKTQMEILRAGVQNGLYTINQGKNFLGLPAVEGGDITIVNGNFIPLEMVGEQWKKGGE